MQVRGVSTISNWATHRGLLFALLSKTDSNVDGEIIPPQSVPIAPVIAAGNDAEARSREKRDAAAGLGCEVEVANT